MANLKSVCLAGLLSLAGCSSQVPPEPESRAVSRVEVTPAVAGYFSIGDMVVPPIEDRVASALRGSGRALIVARLVGGDRAPTSAVRFANSDGSLTEYDAYAVRLRVVRVLDDASRLVAASGASPTELDLMVVDPTAVRRFDTAGRVYLPIPGSVSPIALADRRAVRADVEFIALVSRTPEGTFLLESAEMAGDSLVGDRDRVPLDTLVRRAVEAREGRE